MCSSAARNQNHEVSPTLSGRPGTRLGRGPKIVLLEVRIGAHERHHPVGPVRILGVVAGVEVLAELGGGEHPLARHVVVAPRHRRDGEHEGGEEQERALPSAPAGSRSRTRAPIGANTRRLARVRAARPSTNRSRMSAKERQLPRRAYNRIQRFE